MSLDYWQIAYGGQTQSAAAWGVTDGKRSRETTKSGRITLELDGLDVDQPSPFAFLQPMTITAGDGTKFWQGVVSKVTARATLAAEGQTVEVSDPMFWLENIVFQQMWVSSVISGQALGTITTTQSEVILGQALNGVQMNSGDVIREALIYALYSCAMVPFPTTIGANNLPALPTSLGPGGFVPFIIGTITPSVTVPFSQMRDRSCAEIMRLMLKFSPDCVTSFDMSTTPPTLNIAQRGTLPVRAIQSLGTDIDTNGYMVSGLNPTPRNDLMPSVVVTKFQQTNTINGQTGSALIPQFYPPAPEGISDEVWMSQPRALVQTFDLLGGSQTQQTVDIKVVARPTDFTAGNGANGPESALNWVLRKKTEFVYGPPGLIGPILQPFSPANPYYDIKNVTVQNIATVIDPADPLNDAKKNPNNITLPNCPQLINELQSGHFPGWLQEDPNDLDAALVNIFVTLAYSGNDPKTAALFTTNPANPLSPMQPGAGVLILQWQVRVTNAETQPYTQITSQQAGEPVPVGFAEYLWNCLAQLAFSGTFSITERECTDLLPPGCTFNTTDGAAAWQSMNALVLRVEEDMRLGTTQVTFGPPAHLGLDEMAEIYRAQLGRLQGWKLAQRTDGSYQSGADVIGDRDAGHTHEIVPLPAQVLSDDNPLAPTDQSEGATAIVAIAAGQVGGMTVTGSPVTVAPGRGTIYVQADYTFVNGNQKTMVDAQLHSTTGTVPASTGAAGQSNGSGTFYYAIAYYNAVVTNGRASTAPTRAVSSSLEFDICNGMPVGVRAA